MTFLRRLILSAGIVGVAAGLPAQTETSWWQNLHWNASATAAWTENISRTSFEPTRKDADFYELTLGANQARQIARNLLLEASVTADFLTIPKYDRNDSFTVGPHLGLQHKFGLGALAPVARLDTAYTYKSARIDANTGWTAEAALRFSKRITPAIRLGVNGEWLEHNARSWTYDIQQRTVSFEASWDINEKWRLSGSAGRLSGRIVANAAPQIWSQAMSGALGSTVFDYYVTIPWQIVDSYGPGWVAYNVEADADLWSAALSAALSDRTSLELRTNSVFVVNKIGVRYPTNSWGLSLVHRF